jgi:predicted neutral ceramidase superfamily lipid hydrolase
MATNKKKKASSVSERSDTLFVRITTPTEKALRKRISKRGDLSRIICEVIESCDWASLDVEPRPRGSAVKRAVEYRVILPTVTRELHDEVQAMAEDRGVSVSALIEAALKRAWSRK